MQQPDSLHEFQSQVSLFKPVFEAEETSEVYLILLNAIRIISHTWLLQSWDPSHPNGKRNRPMDCLKNASSLKLCRGILRIYSHYNQEWLEDLKMHEELITANYRLSCLKCSNFLSESFRNGQSFPVRLASISWHNSC